MATKAELELQVASLSKELEEMRGAFRTIAQRFDAIENRLMEAEKKGLSQDVEIAKLKAPPAAKPPAPRPGNPILRY
jgi:uncharacterized coiled-coil protein SlyX